MGAGTKYPLSLIVQAVDKATAPLRRINQQIARAGRFTAPFRRIGGALGRLARESGAPRVIEGFKGVGTAAGKVGEEVFALGKKFAAMGAVAGAVMFGVIHSAVEAGDKLAEMADRVGLSVDSYASLQHAAAQADVEQEAFNDSMDQFNRRLGEMKAGGGSLVGLLKKVSPALLQQMKGAKSNEEAFGLMADAMAKLEDPNKRAALSAAAFGKGGKAMGDFLKQGRMEINRQQVAYVALAGGQEKFARGAGVLDNAMRETQVAFLGVRNAVAGELFPALAELARVITGLVAGNREGLAKWAREVGEAFGAWVKGGGVQRIVAGLKRFLDIAGGLVDRLGGWPVLLAGVAAVVAGPLLGAIGGLISSLVTLGVAMGATPFGWLLAGIAAVVAGAVLLYRNFDAVKAATGPLGEAVGGLFGGFQRLWSALGPLVVPILEVMAEVLKGPLLVSIGLIIGPLETMVKAATALAEALGAIVGYAKESGWLADVLRTVGTASPISAVMRAGNTVAGWLGPDEQPRPTLGAATVAAPQAPGASTEARVTVDFSNLPRGARVSRDPKSDAPLDLSMGYSMVGG